MPDLIQTRVLDRVVELVALVRAVPGCESFPVPDVYFYDKRSAAGIAHTLAHRIGIHDTLLRENEASMLHETVAHEVAHLVIAWRHRKAIDAGRNVRRPAPHGCEWKAVMRGLFKVQPERTHNYSMANVAVRRQRRFAYACPCRVHKIATVKHNKILRGARLICTSCRSPINYLGEVA